jgi:hypothetical protein
MIHSRESSRAKKSANGMNSATPNTSAAHGNCGKQQAGGTKHHHAKRGIRSNPEVAVQQVQRLESSWGDVIRTVGQREVNQCHHHDDGAKYVAPAKQQSTPDFT